MHDKLPATELIMKTCRFCKEESSDKEQICPYCGYNFQTDTLTPNFVGKARKEDKGKKKKLVGPGIKTFVFWTGLVIISSLIFKYQGKLGDLVSQAKDFFKKDKKKKTSQSVGLLEVKSVKVSQEKFRSKEKKIEGIFYDPKGKSYVIINNQLIPEGESFAGIFIKKINKNTVEVIRDGKSQILSVKNNN